VKMQPHLASGDRGCKSHLSATRRKPLTSGFSAPPETDEWPL
jgi:hypothetical protein